jgi:hypothetical protein
LFGDTLELLMIDAIGPNVAELLVTFVCDSVASRIQDPKFKEAPLMLRHDEMTPSALTTFLCGGVACELLEVVFTDLIQ